MTHFACWSPDNKHWKALLCTNITSQIHLQDSGAQDSYRLSFPSHSLISVHRLKDFSLGLLSVCLSFMPKVVLSRSSTQAWLYRFQLDCLDPRISQNDQYLKPGFTSPFVNKPCPSNEFLDLPNCSPSQMAWLHCRLQSGIEYLFMHLLPHHPPSLPRRIEAPREQK